MPVMRWAIGGSAPRMRGRGRGGVGMIRLRVGAWIVFAASAVLLGTVLIPTAASADPISGAIFTTDVTGTEVNVNQYAAKPDVYLNGGPGLNAPIGAAGLSPDAPDAFQAASPPG